MAMSEIDKKSLQIGVFLAVIIGLFVLWYFYYIQRPLINRHNNERKELQTEIDKQNKQLAEMKKMIAESDKVKRDLALVEKAALRLPDSPEVFKFIKELSDILQLTGVKYSKINVQSRIVRTLYTELPYEISCLARYHEFGQFLNMIEQNPNRFMRVKYFTVRNDKDRPSLHPVTLGVATFMFNQKIPRN